MRFKKNLCIVILSLVIFSIISCMGSLKAGASDSDNDIMQAGCPQDNTYITTDSVLEGGTCYVNDTDGDGVLIIAANNIVLDGNGTTLIGDKGGRGVYLDGFINVTIKNLNIENYSIGYMIIGGSYNTLTNSTGNRNAAYGVYTGRWSTSRNPTYSSIINNTFNYNGAGFENDAGISLDSSATVSNNRVIGNTAKFNTNGIYLEDGNSDVVRNNVLVSNAYAGIGVFAPSYSNLSSNLILANGYGVGFTSSFTSHNILFNNTIALNSNGIGIMSSSSNTIYHNSIVNNARQIDNEDDATVNSWDNGAVGNYWSDYNGTDSDGDGIGDLPCVIDAGNSDNYPIVPPFSIENIQYGIINRGRNISFPVTVTSKTSFSSPVYLSIEGLLDDMQTSFSMNPVTPPPGGSVETILTLSTTPETCWGLHKLLIIGSSNLAFDYSTFTLNVQDGNLGIINGAVNPRPEDQINPKIYDNIMIWEERRVDGSRDVYTYNLSSDIYFRVGNTGSASAQMGDSRISDIYNDRVVYSIHYSFPSQHLSHIVYYNTTTGMYKEFYDNTDPPISPSIYEDTIIWLDGPWPWRISKYNLSASEFNYALWPFTKSMNIDLYENNVALVIAEHIVGGYREIAVYDILTHSWKQITYNYLQQPTWWMACGWDLTYEENPSIYKDRIVWEDSRNSEGLCEGPYDTWKNNYTYDIYFYNLTSSSEVQITSLKSNQTNPSIYGDKIVYQDDRNGNWDLYLYDLSKNKESRLTNNPADQINPEIHRNKIVWQDNRNGNWDIYMADLDLFLVAPEATPSPQEVHGNVNISATVFHAQPISKVWVNITDPNGSTAGNFSMSYDVADDEYYYNASYSIIGSYNYTIWAKDADSKWTSSSGSFLIRDTTKPSISNLLYPSNQEVYAGVYFSTEITDNYELADVWINITNPNDEWINITMNKGVGATHYYTQSYAILGPYSFTIWAKDSSDNWNKAQGLFVIEDTSPPGITNLNILPSTQEIYGRVNISATVADNFALSTVSINISKPDATWLNETMLKFGNTYYYNRSYDLIGPYSFTIWANDTSNNRRSSSGGFLIKDSVVPYSSVIPIAPYWYSTSPLKIAADVNEVGSGIKDVALWFRYSGDNSTWLSWTPYLSLESPPWEWSFDFPDGDGFYEFFSTASDNGDNTESMKSAREALAAYDSARPQSRVDSLPYWKSSSPAIITAFASDETSGLKDISLYYRYSADSSTWPSYSLLGTDNSTPWEWSFDFPNGDGYYEFYTIACDNVGSIEGSPPTGDTKVAYDHLPPAIMHVPELEVMVGESIRIVAYVDDMAPKSVRLNYTDIFGYGYIVNMDLSSGLYIYEFPGYAKEGYLFYSIWAEDHAGNSARSAVYRVEISDSYSPEITNIRTTEAALGKGIEVTVTVTDNIAVDKVILHYKGTGDSEFSRTEMVLVSGNDYRATIPPQSEAGTITYSIQATDTNGNIVLGGPYYVPISAKPTESILPTIILLGLYGIAFMLIALYYFERKKVKQRKQ